MQNATCMIDAGHAVGLGGHRDEEVGWVVAADIPHPALNAVRPVRQHAGLVERIPEILSTYPDNVPVAWWLMPDDGREELSAALSGAGFERAAVMPAVAGRVPTTTAKPPPDVVLVTPTTDEDWDAVATVQSDGFSLAPELSATIARSVRALAEHESGPPTLEAVLARKGGVPVSVGFVSHRAEIAGLWSLTTLPAVRGTGVGGAMVDHRLALARARGAEIAFMHSGGNAEPLFTARGFRRIGNCEMHVLPVHTR